MARGQEKVIVPKQDLPPVSLLSDGSHGYIMRYRIVSEDQNRFSHWSPIREIPVPTPIPVDGNLAIIGTTGLAVWGDEESRPNYDVFVSFDGADYFYHGTSPTHNYTFIIDPGTSTVQVAIQIESTTHERALNIQIFESQVVSLV